MVFLRKHFGIFVVILLSFWAVKPFFALGFFPMHDDTQVARVFEMGKALRGGIFPVRWVPDLGYGYGYPIFNFYAPLAYYVGGFFTFLGFDALIATKIMMGIGILLSGIFMYLLAREFWGELGGVLSGLFYVYAPYHALDIYVRGDVAEFWAYAFVPLMFWGFYRVFKGGKWKYVVIGSLGYAGIILSHNLTAMMVTPFLILIVIILSCISYKNRSAHTAYYLIFTSIFALILSAFYWIPALAELRYTNVLSQVGGGADFRDHFVCIQQLWDSPWGFGGSTSTCIDGLSFKIGKLHVLGSLFVFILAIFYSKLKRIKKIVGFSLAGFIISVFLTLQVSKLVWEAIPVMAFFQYPWRFLILVSFFSSLACGSLVLILAKFKVKPYVAVAVLIFFILFFNTKLFIPQYLHQKTAEDYTNERALKWVASKTSDEFLPSNFKKPKSEQEIAQKPLEFSQTNIQKASNSISFIGIIALIVGIILFKNKAKI